MEKKKKEVMKSENYAENIKKSFNLTKKIGQLDIKIDVCVLNDIFQIK